MSDIAAALIKLRPNASWTLDGSTYAGITWYDEIQLIPTQSEIDVELSLQDAEYDSQEYSRLRKVEYNKFNQDEMRYDDLINGTTTWQDAIQAIKQQYPKP